MSIIGDQNPKGYRVEESEVIADRPNSVTYLHIPTNRLWSVRKDNPSQGNNLPSPTVSQVENIRYGAESTQRSRTIQHPDISE